MRKCKGICPVHELGKHTHRERVVTWQGKNGKMHSGEYLKLPVGDLKRNPRRQMDMPLASLRPAWSSLRQVRADMEGRCLPQARDWGIGFQLILSELWRHYSSAFFFMSANIVQDRRSGHSKINLFFIAGTI